MQDLGIVARCMLFTGMTRLASGCDVAFARSEEPKEALEYVVSLFILYDALDL